MNSYDHKVRYLPHYMVQARSEGSHHWTQLPAIIVGDIDLAYREFNEAIIARGDKYDLRLVLCGPPQYDYIVRAVIKFHERKEYQ